MAHRFQLTRAGQGFALLVAALIVMSCAGESGGRDDGTAGQTKDPAVRLLVPAQGFTEGGETVTVLARNFSDDFTVLLPRVYFGNRQVEVTALDAGALEIVTPAHTEGAVDVQVIASASAQSAQREGGFRYRAPDFRVEPALALTCTPVVLKTTEFEGDFRQHETHVYVRGTEAVVTGFAYQTIYFVVPVVSSGLADVTIEIPDTGETITAKDCFEVGQGYSD